MIRAIIFDWGRTLYDSENSRLFPDAKGVLQYLSKKYILAIVSLATDGDFEKRLIISRNEDVEKHFSVVLFARNDKDGLYQQALVHLKLNAHEVAIVDDRIVRGIKWGNKHGAVTRWMRQGKFMNEVPNHETGTPSHTISVLSDLYAELP